MDMAHAKTFSRLVAIMLVVVAALGALAAPRATFADDLPELKENSWRYSDGELIEDSSDVDASGVETLAAGDPWSLTGQGFVNDQGEVIPNAVRKGIDVSHHQNAIDWNQVAASDVDFAIIRCGYGGNYTAYDDRYWTVNADACSRLGIPFGVYLYSYAESVEDARSEAEHVLRLVRNYHLSYPIYYDLEDATVAGCSNEEIAQIAKTFCDIIQANGYDVGIYASKLWFEQRLTDPVFNTWDRWVAQWNHSCTYAGSYAIWQCASDGVVPGVQGRVDIDFEMGSLPNDVVSSAWYVTSGAYDFVASNGIMGTYGGTNMFGPNDSTTRAQFATILWRLNGSPVVSDGATFSDVPAGNFAYDAVRWAASTGLMTGYGDGRFGASDSITREQVSIVLARFGVQRRPSLVAGGTEGLARLADAGLVSAYASSSVNWCAAFGLYDAILDVTGGYLRPTGACTRAEVASMLERLYQGEDAFDYPSDVNVRDWYVVSGDFDYSWDAGIMTGYGNSGLFGPYDDLTRAQAVVILWRIAGEPRATGSGNFIDNADPTAFYYDALRWARGGGIVSGDGDTNRFRPNDSVTREELAVMLANFASEVEGVDVSSDCEAMDAIVGSEDVSSWAREAMGWAVDEGILSGSLLPSGERNLQPGATAQRAQMMTMAVNLIQNVL